MKIYVFIPFMSLTFLLYPSLHLQRQSPQTSVTLSLSLLHLSSISSIIINIYKKEWSSAEKLLISGLCEDIPL